MKLIGRKKQLDALWNILMDFDNKNSEDIPWERIKRWLKNNCEWKD